MQPRGEESCRPRRPIATATLPPLHPPLSLSLPAAPLLTAPPSPSQAQAHEAWLDATLRAAAASGDAKPVHALLFGHSPPPPPPNPPPSPR